MKPNGIIEELEEVQRVDSLLDAQRIWMEDGSLQVEKYADAAEKSPEERSQWLEELRTDPLAKGLVISSDGRHSALIVELVPDPLRAAERGPEIAEFVRETLRQNGFKRDKQHMVGLVASVSEVMVQTNKNIYEIFPIVCAVLLATVFLLFRAFWPVAITFVVSFVSVIWTFGFAILLDRQVSILTAMVPAVMLIVATSDVIHLCSAYLLELGRWAHEKRCRVAKRFRSGGRLPADLVDHLHRLSFAFVRADTHFSATGTGSRIRCGYGAVSGGYPHTDPSDAPARTEGLAKRPPYRSGFAWPMAETGAMAGFTSSSFSDCFFAAVIALAVAGSLQLEIETDLSKRMGEDNRLRQDERYYSAHFAGSNFLDVFVESPKSKGLLDTDTFRKIVEFQEDIEDLPRSRTGFLAGRSDGAHRPSIEPGRTSSTFRRLEPSACCRNTFFCSKWREAKTWERLIDPEKKTLRLAARLSGTAFRSTYTTGETIRALGKERFGNGVQAEPNGIVYLMG